MFNGRVASIGKTVTGTVVWANGNKTKVPADGILCAKMTNPDLLPYMTKSLAVLTQNGGVVCHAAIVCREFGIPCIVGIGSLSLLKEGTIVTVDTENNTITTH